MTPHQMALAKVPPIRELMFESLLGRAGTFFLNHVAYALILSQLNYPWFILLPLAPIQVWLDAQSNGLRIYMHYRHAFEAEAEYLRKKNGT